MEISFTFAALFCIIVFGIIILVMWLKVPFWIRDIRNMLLNQGFVNDCSDNLKDEIEDLKKIIKTNTQEVSKMTEEFKKFNHV